MSAAPPAAPRFSVILPTHDRLDLLRAAIASVVAQTFTDWELIVADDASPRPMAEHELRALAGERASLVRLPAAQGGAAAKRAGAAAATGQVLAFLDDDDLWAPDYLEQAQRALLAAPEVRVLFMGVRWFGERAASGQEAQERGMALIRAQGAVRADNCGAEGLLRYPTAPLFTALLARVPMPFQRPVVYRTDYQAIGPYRAECLLWDCDWALRAVLHGACAELDRPLYLQRASGQGYSSQGRRALEHGRSNLEIKTTLLHHPAVAAQGLGREVRAALHRDWKDHAWQLLQRGARSEARTALRAAFRYGMSLELARLLLRSLRP
jgi:glycosyltransferase involved in cell wall biosynthesis